MPFGLRNKSRVREEEIEKVDQEVSFWKRQLELCVTEKNGYVQKCAKVCRDNELLRAQLLLFQQEYAYVKQQLDATKQQSSRRSTIEEAEHRHHAPLRQSRALSCQPQEPTGLICELSAARMQLKQADCKVAALEERVSDLQQENDSLQNQIEFMKKASEAYHREALTLRKELSTQQGINDETADVTTKLLAELSRVQQENTQLKSDLALKEDIVCLLSQQLADLADGQQLRVSTDSANGGAQSYSSYCGAPYEVLSGGMWDKGGVGMAGIYTMLDDEKPEPSPHSGPSLKSHVVELPEDHVLPSDTLAGDDQQLLDDCLAPSSDMDDPGSSHTDMASCASVPPPATPDAAASLSMSTLAQHNLAHMASGTDQALAQTAAPAAAEEAAADQPVPSSAPLLSSASLDALAASWLSGSVSMSIDVSVLHPRELLAAAAAAPRAQPCSGNDMESIMAAMDCMNPVLADEPSLPSCSAEVEAGCPEARRELSWPAQQEWELDSFVPPSGASSGCSSEAYQFDGAQQQMEDDHDDGCTPNRGSVAELQLDELDEEHQAVSNVEAQAAESTVVPDHQTQGTGTPVTATSHQPEPQPQPQPQLQLQPEPQSQVQHTGHVSSIASTSLHSTSSPKEPGSDVVRRPAGESIAQIVQKFQQAAKESSPNGGAAPCPGGSTSPGPQPIMCKPAARTGVSGLTNRMLHQVTMRQQVDRKPAAPGDAAGQPVQQ